MNLVEVKKLYQKYFAALPEEDKQKFTGYFYIILTLLAVSFFGMGAIGPTLNTVSNLDKQYKDNKLIYSALHEKFINLTLLDAQFQNIKGDLDSIYSAIPKTAEIPKLTRQLENLAAEHNLQITALNFSTIEVFPNLKNEPIYAFSFNINVSGTENDVNNFIADVINFDRIIGVDRIVTGTNQEKKYTVSFTGKSYFAPK